MVSLDGEEDDHVIEKAKYRRQTLIETRKGTNGGHAVHCLDPSLVTAHRLKSGFGIFFFDNWPSVHVYFLVFDTEIDGRCTKTTCTTQKQPSCEKMVRP